MMTFAKRFVTGAILVGTALTTSTVLADDTRDARVSTRADDDADGFDMGWLGLLGLVGLAGLAGRRHRDEHQRHHEELQAGSRRNS